MLIPLGLHKPNQWRQTLTPFRDHMVVDEPESMGVKGADILKRSGSVSIPAPVTLARPIREDWWPRLPRYYLRMKYRNG